MKQTYTTAGLPYDDLIVTKDVIENYKREWKKHGFPDVDLRAQGRGHSNNLNDPVSQPTEEALLWSCVLSEAFVDVERGRLPSCSKKQRIDADDAVAWFAATTNQPGDFEWVCDVLGFDCGYIRGKVVKGTQAIRQGRRYTVIAQPHGRSKGIT
jgi:hypothetical protein